MNVISACNQKGGVGKTTTVRNLARAASQGGRRVLVIDADPQGNLTSALGVQDMPEDVAGVADALSQRSPQTLTDVIVPTIWEGVDLAPTSGDTLEAVRDELVIAGPGREARLRGQIHALGERYDLVLIDTRPSLDQLTINALVASDGVLIITNPELFAINGIEKLNRTIITVREHYNPNLTLVGVLINHHESATTIQSRHWVEEIDESGLPVLAPAIPRHTWISRATATQEALDELGTDGQAVAKIYDHHLSTMIGALA